MLYHLTSIMHISLSFRRLLLAASSLWLTTAASPHPQLSYVPVGTCTIPGKLVCLSNTTFVICDQNLQGIVQNLAVGDNRCVVQGSKARYQPASTVRSPASVPMSLYPTFVPTTTRPLRTSSTTEILQVVPITPDSPPHPPQSYSGTIPLRTSHELSPTPPRGSNLCVESVTM